MTFISFAESMVAGIIKTYCDAIIDLCDIIIIYF